jgi:hypothetical protein
MRKFKKVLAIGMALTMLLGSSMAAFADDNSGSSSGAGRSEGHVEEKATNVVLPSVTEGTTPFAYTMDPEGLIQETSGGKYDNAEFPAEAGDKHVYFNNGAKGGEGTDKDNIVYANTSPKLKVENRSSHNIKLTISVTASSATTDIPLVAQTALAGADNASLYLGLKVDSEDPVAITTSAAASKEVTINGTPGNFKIAVNSGKTGYEYRVMTLDEYKAIEGNSAATALPWSSSEFQLEGEVTTGKKIASDTTAPTVAVTWSWVDPTATPEVTTATISSGATAVEEGSDKAEAGVTHTASLVTGADTTIAFSLPTGVSVKNVYVAGSINGLSNNTENADRAAVSGSNVVVKGDSDWATTGSGVKYLKVVVGSESETTATFIIEVTISGS